MPPDPTKPNYGPGFLLDNPARAGNCATCHAPVASTTTNTKNCSWLGCHMSITTQNSASLGIMDPGVMIPKVGIGVEGITCEFCHKIGDVILDPKTNLPYPDMPGILSYKLFRPAEGQSVFFGPMLDVPRNVSLFNPGNPEPVLLGLPLRRVWRRGGHRRGDRRDPDLQFLRRMAEQPLQRSQDRKNLPGLPHAGKGGCQLYVFPEQGGLVRDYYPFHDHTMTGINDDNLMKNAVTMKTGATHTGNTLQVQVSVTNDKTGHDVPTDAPIRSVMLVVTALDANGKPLVLSQGPVTAILDRQLQRAARQNVCQSVER